MQLLGPDSRAFQSPISEMHGKAQQTYLDSQKSLYPRGDYRDGALRINWKTGTLTIVARGAIDKTNTCCLSASEPSTSMLYV